MNLLGFLHLILLYAWPEPIFLKKKKKKTWLHIGLKFFRFKTEFPIL